jgi:lysophospholipase L1-like esterase
MNRVCLAGLLILCTAAQARGQSIRVACVGDSITAGVGVANPASQSWPAQLQRLLGAGYEVGNFGHSGATLSKAGRMAYWSKPAFKAATSFRADIVIIHLGTNDAIPAVWPEYKHPFVPTLKGLIEHFRTRARRPKVYVCLPVPSFENRADNIRCGLVPLVRQAAREADTPLIDLNAPLRDRTDLFPDRLHPNEAGAGLMAALVAAEIGGAATDRSAWRVASVDSEEASEGPANRAIDGDPLTYWHTGYSKGVDGHPHQIEIDLGSESSLLGLRYLPRQGAVNGRVRRYELYLSGDGMTWAESPAASGTFRGTADPELILLPSPATARYVRFRALSEINGGPWTSVAELDVLRLPADPPAATGPAGRR